MTSADKEKYQARLEKMSKDEILENLPNFGNKKKSADIDELMARGRDQELKARSRKKSARWIGVLAVLALAVCAVITLIILAQL